MTFDEIYEQQKDFIIKQLRQRNEELYIKICRYTKNCFGEKTTIFSFIEEKYIIERILFHYDQENKK